MKKYKAFLIAMLTLICAIAIIGLAACSSTGEKGDTGATGATGTAGSDGTDGSDGDDAYSIYVDTYGYSGTIQEWLEDLINGNLATVTYTVTFDTAGGSSVESQTVVRGGKVEKPENVTRQGYVLSGWQTQSGETWSFAGSSVTSDITLVAIWELQNSFTFSLNDDNQGYTLSAYNGIDSEVVIPSEYNGLPVTAIAAQVFSGNTDMQEVYIPASVTSVSDFAFSDATGITDVYYGGTATQWAGITFARGSSVPTFYGANLYFANGGETYTLATDVVIESGTTAINACVFYGSTITSISIPASVTTIGHSAFKACGELTTITVAEDSQLDTIGYEAFYESGITSITIPDGVTEIAYDTFRNCYSLASVTLGSATTSIGANALEGTLISKITIPATVTSIGEDAFANCYKLLEVYDLTTDETALNITAGSVENGGVAAYALYVYNSADTASSLTTTEGFVFYIVTSSSTYILVDYVGTDTDITLPKLEVLGSTINYEVYQYAFYRSNITSVIVPEYVTDIGDYAFYCDSLEAMYFVSSSTATGEYSTGSALIYYYSETQPASNYDSYWHYDSESKPVVWTEPQQS